MKNPEHRPEPRINAQWFGRWISVFAAYPPEHDPSFVTPDFVTVPQPTQEYASPTDDKISRSQMMRLLTNMASRTLNTRSYVVGSSMIDYESRWYAAGLIGALHALEAEREEPVDADDTFTQDIVVSYNDLRSRVDAYAEFEAVPEGDLSCADFVSDTTAEQFAAAYEKAQRPS